MPKQIYLTIDDSPSTSFRSNLDFLIAHEIPAVFFCIGSLMQQYWQDIIYAIQQGYLIGNHSYNHPHFSDLSLGQAKKEIYKTDKLIHKAYTEAGVEYYDRLFRFPYGDKGDGKYGFHFMDFVQANKKRQGRWDRLVSKINSFNPINSMGEAHREAEEAEKAYRLQQYLFQLGYVRGDLIGVDYDFFHALSTGQDWSWTFDIGEYRWDGKQSESDFLTTVYDRLDSERPEDYRGDIGEPSGLQVENYIDIVLFHDRDATNVFFEPIIKYLLRKQVEFLPIDFDQIKMV